ncbi:response regulator [Hoeflea prorocentri]|uniref:Response regulator n=1 Tax=Hoeflea prorocentri TaxID=1922333 RepID=A0A9X3UJS2_9HYPH|nr:response regulator [Hoeflea prorocentri]MCY6381939.1 response regulator [Hoeflea prorocentri]MDA5399739.1 response regulator [Hoeflea prorocentri]
MNAAQSHILVCDDETHLREMVGEYLIERGYRVTEAPDASYLHEAMEDDAADLIVLDINMPGQDGLSALRTLRTSSTVPVIMLTASAEVVDRVVGLEMGADDYVGKPVDLRELEARIKATLRRHATIEEETKRKELVSGTVPFGVCRLDLDAAKLYGSNGNEIAITAMEFSLLRVFASNRGRILNRDQLLEQAHDRGWEPFDRSIDLRISRIRKKVEKNPKKPECIRTVRGIGYIFD